jgi:apolipoprotein D and lipocalin family protein
MRLGFIVLWVFAVAGCMGTPAGVKPVTHFDAGRYLGNGYEIARLAHPFERGLHRITATYSARADGGMDIVNRGMDAAGAWQTARGLPTQLKSPTWGI